MTTMGGPEGTPLSDAVFRVARLHKSLAGRLLRAAGLYPGQELVLLALWDQGPQRQVDLVRALDSDAPSITRGLNRLEKAGLVTRTRSATDRRSTVVAATEQSLLLRPAVEDAWRRLERATRGALTPKQCEAIVGGLRALEDNLADEAARHRAE